MITADMTSQLISQTIKESSAEFKSTIKIVDAIADGMEQNRGEEARKALPYHDEYVKAHMKACKKCNAKGKLSKKCPMARIGLSILAKAGGVKL